MPQILTRAERMDWKSNHKVVRGMPRNCNECLIDKEARCLGALSEGLAQLERRLLEIAAQLSRLKAEIERERGQMNLEMMPK